MKIHIVGPYYGYPYCINKAVERALKLLGHSVVITDPRSSARHGKDFIEEIRATTADLILCTSIEAWHRAFKPSELPPKVLWLREEIRRPIIQSYYNEVSDFYEKIFYFDVSSFHHFETPPHYLPLAFDPFVHYKETSERDLDIVFIGSLETKEGSFYKNRMYALDLIQKANLPLQTLESWDPIETSKLYSRAKIVWNLGSYWEESGPVEDLRSFGYQNRVFEGLASGALVFNHKVTEGSLFDDKKHIIEYDGSDLASLLNHYLTHEKESREIASCGFDLALKDHTYKNRMETILGIMECS